MSSATSLAEAFRLEISEATSFLVERGLVDDQNTVTRRHGPGGSTLLESSYWSSAPRVQQKVRYDVLYAELKSGRFYDLKFLDGALVQMRFEFSRVNILERAVLRYLPSPILTSYQEDPDLYLNDEVYGDVVDIRTVTTPLRFDFDTDPNVVREVLHPASHLTIGQYPHCRIPATSPITPHYFLRLIVHGFYRTMDVLGTDGFPRPRAQVTQTISKSELQEIHIGHPGP